MTPDLIGSSAKFRALLDRRGERVGTSGLRRPDPGRNGYR